VLAFALSAGLLAGGCDACEDKPPIPAVSSSDAGVLDLAPEPEQKDLDAAWSEAAGQLEVKPGDAAKLAYTIPKCSVRYALRSTVLGEVAEGRQPAGMEVVAELVGNPDADRLTWQLVSLVTFLLHDGEREERVTKKGNWAPALVRTDGKRWFEEKGPTALWKSHTALPPLGSLFPGLPKKEGEYSWQVDTISGRTTAKIERRREEDPDAEIPKVKPDSYVVTLKVDGGVKLSPKDGEGNSMRATVLRGRWVREETTVDPIESQRAERWKGRWVVAENGRLVHAIMKCGKYQWWATSEHERNSKIGSIETELRLIEDCDTPTLSRFPTEG
jgi:hypothetical protein